MTVRIAILVSLVAVGFIGCGGEGDGAAGEVPTLPHPRAAAISQTIAEASPEQAAALADGYVTATEYETAMLEMTRCMTENGIEWGEEPHWEATGTFIRFTYISGATQEAARETSQVYERCRRQYSESIEFIWLIENEPSEEQLRAARASLARCLRENGAEVPDNPSSEELIALHGHKGYTTCAEKSGRENGIGNFFG